MTIAPIPSNYPAALGWSRNEGRPVIYLILWRLTL